MAKKPLYKSAGRKINRLLMRMVLAAIFRPLVRKPVFEGPLNTIVIVSQEKLGDVIVLTPLIKNLRSAYPSLRIEIIAFSAVAEEFFKNDPNIAAVHTPKKDYFAYFRAIEKKEFDLLFCPKDHLSFSAVFFSRTIKARHRVGIFHLSLRGFFNHLVQVPFLAPVIEKNCALLGYVGVEYVKEQSRPYLPRHEVSESISEFASGLEGRGAIAINLCAGEPDREWPIEKWHGLLERIKRPVVIFSMPDRLADKLRLEAQFAHIVPSPQTRSIYEVAAIIARLDLLISPDTSLIHAASCSGTPVVGLYRSDENHYKRFPPWLIENVMIISPTLYVKDIPLVAVVDGAISLLNGKNHGT